MSDHIATFGSVGSSGRRCGTGYIYTPRQAWAYQGELWFRFRNADCERKALTAWGEAAPISGEFFDVADESEEPNIGHSTPAPDDLTKCSLASFERDGMTRCWGRHLQQIGDTEYFRWYQKRADYCWHPMGRLLKLNNFGRAAIAKALGGE